MKRYEGGRANPTALEVCPAHSPRSHAQVLSAFPSATGVWVAYCSAELGAGVRDDTALRSLFARSLLACPSVDLWALYTRFVTLTHDVATAEGCAAARGAHEFALQHLGEDASAGALHADYLRFLRTAPAQALHPDSPNGESARMVDVRRAFTAALTLPHGQLESLWREYEAFENALSRQLARPMLQELQPRVAAARGVAGERRRLAEAARVATPPLPPPVGTCMACALAWRAYVAHECDSARVLSSVRRGALAWDQALAVFAAWPEFWLAASRWHALAGRLQEAAAVLARAVAALPANTLLALVLCEAEEAAGDAPHARARFQQLLHLEQPGQDAVEEEPPTQGAPVPSQDMSDHAALLWAAFLRFSRRAEGATAARRTFARARRCSGGAVWRVYLAAAEQEHSGGDSQVARNILELGLKNCALCVDYVLAYAEWLVRLGDATNARVLFERALASLADAAAGDGTAPQPPNRPSAAPIWDAFVAFEYAHGTLAGARSVDARRVAAVGDPPPKDVALETLQRFTLQDLVPVPAELVEHFASGDAPSAQPLPPMPPPQPAAPRPPPAPPAGPVAPPAPPAWSAPPVAGPPVDPLQALGLNELISFLGSLPPASAIAFLPIPSADAVLQVLLRTDPTQWLLQMQCAQLPPAQQQQFMQQMAAQQAAQQHAAMAQQQQQMQMQQGGPPKRKAEEMQPQMGLQPDTGDMFRARMRARGVRGAQD